MGSIWSGLVSHAPAYCFAWICRAGCRISADADLDISVIVLIAAEILVAGINIVVDLYAGVD